MTLTIHEGTRPSKIQLGDKEIPCAVLEDGTRILSEFGITRALGSRSGASKRLKKDSAKSGRAPLPVFVAPPMLKAFISDELRDGLTNPIKYKVGGRVAMGYPAELLPQICDVWLKAREVGAIQKQQMRKCQLAEVLMRGLAHVGIIALVDEATGYQESRTKQALQEILEKFIAKELRPWIKTFPDDYYKHIFRLNNWHYDLSSVKRPSVIGRWTNDIVYDRLAPKVREELQSIAERDNKGRPKHRYFQRLTGDVGHPKLKEHLAAVIALMRASNSWAQFNRSLQRALPKYGTTLLLPGFDNDD